MAEQANIAKASPQCVKGQGSGIYIFFTWFLASLHNLSKIHHKQEVGASGWKMATCFLFFPILSPSFSLHIWRFLAREPVGWEAKPTLKVGERDYKHHLKSLRAFPNLKPPKSRKKKSQKTVATALKTGSLLASFPPFWYLINLINLFCLWNTHFSGS